MTLAAAAAAATVAALGQLTPAWAQQPAGAPTQDTTSPATAGQDGGASRTRVANPDASLAKGWRTSRDRAVSVVGDAQGLHVLVADSTQAYQWRQAALLREQGFDADAWIGNACVTGSGARAVVVYAPRTFTNDQQLFDRGAFAAVVDLDKGTVTKLGVNVSLAYFNPGCGTGETAVLSQAADIEQGKTRLLRLDTAKAAITARTEVPGEVTSAVPVADGTVAAAGNRLLHISPAGARRTLATAVSTPFRLHPDAGGGVDFLTSDGKQADVRRVAGGRNVRLAHGALGAVGLQAGTAGRVFVTGAATRDAALPAAVSAVTADPQATVSSQGQLVVDQAVSAGLASHVASPLSDQESASPDLDITAHAVATGAKFSFQLAATGGGAAAERPSPALGGAVAPAGAPTGGSAKTATAKTATAESGTAKALAAQAASDATSTVDADHICAVPRNDPAQQALQPTPNQVEWAVDMAIRGDLTSGWLTQGGWRAQDGLGSSVAPSTMFPMPALTGAAAGARIPAQVLLGILAQESNLWEASFHSLPGQTGNPLVGNYYGTNIYPGTTGYDPSRIWVVDWSKHDCGYGLGQQTDGMSLDQDPSKPPGLPAAQQRAIALDYASNIAIAAQTLAKKWNELHTAGQTIKINDDDPQYLENWFAAAWNYNLGFNPPGTDAGNWGLGWANNPANPKYPKDRFAFLDTGYADAAHPQNWPYEEKVMGWAAYPIDTGRSYSDSGVQDSGNTHGYQAAWWSDASARTRVKPALSTFCNSNNGCDSGNPPDCGTAACYTPYWYHSDASWKTCSLECGHETLTYKTLRVEPGRGNSETPDCTTSGLPSNALVIDDVATSVPTMRTDCGKSWTDSGSLTWQFEPTAGTPTTYEGKEDFHQVGGGFGGHFWFSHTRNPSGQFMPQMKVTGTWTLSQTVNGWARVMVHLPSTGAETQQAHYRIYGISGGPAGGFDRYVNQSRNSNAWVSLGVYHFAGTPKVSLSNETYDGSADDDVAWDALAVQPLPGKPQHIVASLGDSYSSGEGAGNYFPESDQDHGTSTWNACSRSKDAWPRKLVLPGETASLGSLSDSWSTGAELGFVACSGAKTWNVEQFSDSNGEGSHPIDWDDRTANSPADGQFHEMNQIDSGVLDGDTTLVTLSIGGNDDNAFTDAVMACAIPPTDCGGDDFLATYEGKIDADQVNIKKTMQQIRAKAPHARIMLVVYPRPLSLSLTCDAAVGAIGSDPDTLAQLADYMDGQDQDTVNTLAIDTNDSKMQEVSPISFFADHGVCDSDAWIKGLSIGPNSQGDFHAGDPNASCVWKFDTCVSRESFHPNGSGTSGYAVVVEEALNQDGYTGG
ncbi:SGNH/GDSL hydrolase family protein [Streptomyces sp. V4-01]|uniref:SGNH/GDSL hydrolase family protein n=1 Tax=Actinacidiphila polyblastidii TaxID=3110430 RepID=A0ABU7P6V3_9ACTN|nr:SGNH/GDSL hydrolase family protein [Streptomyces sp. V4-01]